MPGPTTTEFSITNSEITMTGSEIPFVVPGDVGGIGLQASGGTINFRGTVTGGVNWPILDGSKEFLDMRSISGGTLFFIGTGPAKIIIRIIRGSLS